MSELDKPIKKQREPKVNIYLLTDLDKVNGDSTLLGKLTKLAKTQAPFPIILAKIGFLESDLAYEQLLLGKAPNILKALELGRKQGLFELSEAQYKNAKYGRQKALDNLLLSRGNKVNMKDGYETVNSIDKKELESLTVDNPDIVIDGTIDKAKALALISDLVKSKIKLSKSQITALCTIVKAETIAFNPLTDKVNVSFEEGTINGRQTD